MRDMVLEEAVCSVDPDGTGLLELVEDRLPHLLPECYDIEHSGPRSGIGGKARFGD